MTENTAERSGTWSSPESHLTIEYPLALLDEIRLAVSSSFHANPRGGADIGGVFYGTRRDNVVRIAAWRRISREHPYEPVFALSQKDLADLQQLLASTPAELRNLEPVGWFVPHPRGGLDLTANDQSIFEHFFPRPGQFALVLQPDLVGPTRAAFRVRNAEGTLSEHKRQQEFTLEPLHAPRSHGRNSPTAPPRAPTPPVNNRRDQSENQSSQRTFEAPLFGVRPSPDSILPRPERKGRRVWLWVIPAAAILIIAAVVARDRFSGDAHPATLALKLQDWPGAQLHVDWAPGAQPIQTARRGEIVLDDGGRKNTVQLDPSQLRLGTFAYARRSGNVKVKLSVYGDNNASPAIEEAAEFNGAPPPDGLTAEDRAAWAKQKADLDAEITKLRSDLATEKAHRQELQRLIKILDNQLKQPK